MKKIKAISVLLSLIMCIQILPYAQIGFALGTGQFTEELPHNSSEESGKSDAGCGQFLAVPQHRFASDLALVSACSYIYSSAQIPSNHSTDVVSPPPDTFDF